MSPTMSDLAASLAIAAAMLLSGVARAQAPAPRVQAQAPGGLTESAPVQTLNRPIEQGPHVLFSIGGFGIVVNAPVQGPGNSNIGFQTYQGQPMTGRESILSGVSGSGPAD